jgi:hypothetical protein
MERIRTWIRILGSIPLTNGSESLIRMRIQEAQKQKDSTDPDANPEH